MDLKIIDSHVHLFDPTRKQGIPWPSEGSPIYKAYLPHSYQKIAEPFDIVSAIAVEASPWVEDNEWLLEQVNASSFFAGCVGNLDLSSLEFPSLFERFSKNKKYLGLRGGDLWDRDLLAQLQNPTTTANLKLMADYKKSLDLANPSISLLKAVVKIKNLSPNLRIIIDHLPNIKLEDKEMSTYNALLNDLREIENVYIKFSEIAQPSLQGKIFDVNFYKNTLDRLWEIFTPEKILFGSDYPNSEHLGNFSEILTLVKDYLQNKSLEEQNKVFFLNAQKAYDLGNL